MIYKASQLGGFLIFNYLLNNGDIMGNKRRQMFNPKFKRSTPKRWEAGERWRNKKNKSNSETIEILQQQIETIPETQDVAVEIINNIEEMISEIPKPTYKTKDLKKKKKADLLKIADSLNCEVTVANTKAQIITAIEKQSS